MPERDPDTTDTPTTLLEHDVACMGCDYNLRTQAPGGVCPECGTAIADALRADLLRFADQRWVKRLRRGASLLLVGFAVFIGIYGMVLLPLVFGFGMGFGMNVTPMLMMGAVLGGLIAMSLGTESLTVREPAPQGAANRTTWARSAVRGLFAFSLAGYLLVSLDFRLAFSGFVVLQAASVAFVLGVNLLLVHLRVLARRGPASRLVLLLTVLVWAMASLTAVTTIDAMINLWWQGWYYSDWNDKLGDFAVSAGIGIAIMVVVVAVGTVVATVLLRGMLRGELKRHVDVPRILLVASQPKGEPTAEPDQTAGDAGRTPPVGR